MKHELKKLPKSLVEISFEISPDEMMPYLERAAGRVSERLKVPGFRPGKAPLDVILNHAGPMAVWEEAAEEVVRKVYAKIVENEKLASIGSPHIEIVKLAPGNAFLFKATVPTLPEVALGDYANLKVTRREVSIDDDKVKKNLGDLQKMQSREAASDAPLSKNGKAVVNMSISMDGVPLSGGETKEHSIYMEEEYYIPGLKDKLIGAKKGDTLSFKLPFPKEHFQKNLAGREADFKIDVTGIYELTKPELDDAFAQAVGQKTIAELRELIKKNMESEAAQKEDERFEIEFLEKASAHTTFGDIPDILVNEESVKMLRELKENISRQGMVFEDYLSKIGKTLDQLKLDFAPEALKRVKVALLLRRIAETQHMDISEKEIEEEAGRIRAMYKDDPETQKAIASPEARVWLKNFLLNRKSIGWLKEHAQKTTV